MSVTTKADRAGAIRRTLSFTVANWRDERPLAFSVAGCITLATLADILIPFYAGRLVDALSATGETRELGPALQALGAMAALGIVFVAARHCAWASVVPMTLRIMRRVGEGTFGRVQHFSASWHANSFSGSVVRQITRGMWALDLLHDILLLALLPSMVMLVGTVALLSAQWPVMGLAMGTGAVLYVAMTVVLSTRWVAPISRISNRLDTRVGGVIADALACNGVVKAFGAEAREEARLGEALGAWAIGTRRTWMRGTWLGTLQTVVLWGIRIGIAGVAVLLWWRGEASPGDVTYILTTYFVLHGYLRDIGMHVNNLQRSVNELEELVDLHDERPEVRDAPNAPAIVPGPGAIRFEDVRFHYGAHATPLYDGLSVAIPAGQRVGLVGPSGSGKTTFVKLIQRLHDVAGGRVLVDGQDVAAVAQVSLRRRIAVVPQESILFHRTLAENIAYARPEATRQEIEAAARLAHADAFIARMPDGYDTLVGERGVKLSGGERQRIALARAFLADAPILVLDEATSALDSQSEHLIQAATERLMAGRTALVIAHRLSTVRSLDRILVFDRGRIVEDGAPAELMLRSGGLYRALVEQQSAGMIGG
ncbi:ABC transporter ATP-binding protein [Aureimonas sp. Leaf324]|uniref:ABC transporter ATP-binding protein n=1 Tax=Aureimonas sp. Leaf324 TaxID=1736336 RepID=UPI0006FB75E2|nr:ABC transporter ATP-binding protein [Aureimonas sp. Leaf324]KQQ82022.1 multidrug ABC transporter ATP-binding protein [Aureimonas sp. Leaf324]